MVAVASCEPKAVGGLMNLPRNAHRLPPVDESLAYLHSNPEAHVHFQLWRRTAGSEIAQAAIALAHFPRAVAWVEFPVLVAPMHVRDVVALTSGCVRHLPPDALLGWQLDASHMPASPAVRAYT